MTLHERRRLSRNVQVPVHVNPFTPESDQCQNSPAASQEIWHYTVWRAWLFIAYSDEKWLYYKFSLHHSYNRFLKGWENTLFELRSERVNLFSWSNSTRRCQHACLRCWIMSMCVPAQISEPGRPPADWRGGTAKPPIPPTAGQTLRGLHSSRDQWPCDVRSGGSVQVKGIEPRLPGDGPALPGYPLPDAVELRAVVEWTRLSLSFGVHRFRVWTR